MPPPGRRVAAAAVRRHLGLCLEEAQHRLIAKELPQPPPFFLAILGSSPEAEYGVRLAPNTAPATFRTANKVEN